MRFEAKFPKENFPLLMRRTGYAPEGTDEKTGEWRFSRYLGYGGRSRYPRFHMYCSMRPKERTASCNLHIDQRQPSYNAKRYIDTSRYGGVSAHSGEYEGELVEEEVRRIQDMLEKEA